MNFGVKFRLIALVSGVALMGALIAFAIVSSRREGLDLRARLGSVDSETDEIAAHFKDTLRELSNARLQYAIGHDPAVWRQFLEVSGDLKAWIDAQAPKLTTSNEQEALAQVRSAYDGYLRQATKMAAGSGGPAGPADSLAAFSEVRAGSQRLFDLGQALARAHYQSRNQLLAYANQRLNQMRLLMLGLLGLIFVFGAALALVAYRDLIAPLRVRLVESQSLAERNEKLASLGMLAAGVAHEIRNPLTAIKAALFLQQKQFRPGTPEAADGELIQREILRLERIVNDFLLFARPGEPVLAPVPADQSLREVSALFAPELAQAGIRMAFDAQTTAPVRVDAAQLKQVLINLVKNAVESMGRGGTLTLRARRDRRALAQRETEVVVLEVGDTGKGIPPEAGRRLFDPFFTTKESGTGLGLSIAARIVAKHGGAIQYQSRANHGTTFWVVLPVSTP
jgi:signal transduction histidine kinase